MKPAAAVLQRISPKPLWTSSVSQPDISEIYQLEGGVLLASFRDLQQVGGFYLIQKTVNGPYIAFDMDTGSQKWQFVTNPDETVEYAAIPAGGVVFIRENNKEGVIYHALDSVSGAELWSLNVGISHVFDVNPSSGVVVFAEYQSGNSLFAVEMTTGREKWRVKDAFKGEARIPTVKLRGNELLLVDDMYVNLRRSDDGKLTWKSRSLGPVPARSFPLWLKDGVLIPTTEGVLVKLNSKGEVAWSARLEGEPGILSLTEKNIYIQVFKSIEKKKWDVVCLSFDRGKDVWRRSLSGTDLVSDFQILGDTLAFSSEDNLEIWNAVSGQVNNSVRLMKKNPLLSRDFDSIRIYPDHVVVGNEEWVASYSRKTGKRMWFFKIPWPRKYALSDAVKERQDWLEVWLSVSGAPKKDRSQTLQVMRSQDDLNFKAPTNHAQRNLDVVMAETDYVLNNRYSTRQERQGAHEQRITAINGSIAVAETNMAMAKMTNAINMQMNAWDNILGAVEMTRQVKAQAEVLGYKHHMIRENARVPIARNAQYLTMQQNWYVRPFDWADGQGLLLVDMETGRWREIITSPEEGEEIKEQFIAIPLSLISLDGKRFFSHGIGLDSDRWVTDDRFLTKLTVQRSVQCFDLDAIKWRQPDQYPEYSVGASR